MERNAYQKACWRLYGDISTDSFAVLNLAPKQASATGYEGIRQSFHVVLKIKQLQTELARALHREECHGCSEPIFADAHAIPAMIEQGEATALVVYQYGSNTNKDLAFERDELEFIADLLEMEIEGSEERYRDAQVQGDDDVSEVPPTDWLQGMLDKVRGATK